MSFPTSVVFIYSIGVAIAVLLAITNNSNKINNLENNTLVFPQNSIQCSITDVRFFGTHYHPSLNMDDCMVDYTCTSSVHQWTMSEKMRCTIPKIF